MLSNITSNSSKELNDKQASLKGGDRVYLYNDPKYTGSLMRPVDKTYPPRWTVALDRGGYEAANVENIELIEDPHSESHEVVIPKDNESENIPKPIQTVETEGEKIAQLEQQIKTLHNRIGQLEAENQFLQQQSRELERENQRLKEELKEAKNIIRHAKDISPLMRISLKRVVKDNYGIKPRRKLNFIYLHLLVMQNFCLREFVIIGELKTLFIGVQM